MYSSIKNKYKRKRWTIKTKTNSINRIIGYKEEKRKLQEIIDMINHHEELEKQNISTPKGVIIAGPSGCGKTLFSEVLMNSVNLKKIRFDSSIMENDSLCSIVNIFEDAKKNKNRIILIDDINQLFSENPFNQGESYRVLRALVSEIDSIEDKDRIFIVATTSDIDGLNESIYRSGRLDQIINLSYPNNLNRKKLLQESLSSVKFSKNLSMRDLVNYTNSFSVADVIRFANDCKRELLLQKKEILDDKTSSDITNEICLKSNSIENDKKSNDIISYHEAGHAICSLALKQSVSSISILKYNNSLGNTRMYGEQDSVKSKEDLLNMLVILYGGRVAETYKYGTEFTGSSEDIIRATMLAKEMVSCLGMYGIEHVTRKENEIISNKRLREREDLINKILCEAYEKAKKIIMINSTQLEKIHDLLIQNKTITSNIINKIKIELI